MALVIIFNSIFRLIFLLTFLLGWLFDFGGSTFCCSPLATCCDDDVDNLCGVTCLDDCDPCTIGVSPSLFFFFYHYLLLIH